MSLRTFIFAFAFLTTFSCGLTIKTVFAEELPYCRGFEGIVDCAGPDDCGACLEEGTPSPFVGLVLTPTRAAGLLKAKRVAEATLEIERVRFRDTLALTATTAAELVLNEKRQTLYWKQRAEDAEAYTFWGDPVFWSILAGAVGGALGLGAVLD